MKFTLITLPHNEVGGVNSCYVYNHISFLFYFGFHFVVSGQKVFFLWMITYQVTVFFTVGLRKNISILYKTSKSSEVWNEYKSFLETPKVKVSYMVYILSYDSIFLKKRKKEKKTQLNKGLVVYYPKHIAYIKQYHKLSKNKSYYIISCTI